MTLDGGHLKERHAIHHAQNVRAILQALEPMKDDLECLLEEGELQIANKWEMPILDSNKKKPGTVKPYLTSVTKFFQFLNHTYETGMQSVPDIPGEFKPKLPTLINRVKAWVSSISRKFEGEKWRQILEDSRNAITPEDARDVNVTGPALEAQKLLQKSRITPLNAPAVHCGQGLPHCKVGT